MCLFLLLYFQINTNKMKRGMSQTRFYDAKNHDDSGSSLCSTSEDDMFEPNGIIIPETNRETGEGFSDSI